MAQPDKPDVWFHDIAGSLKLPYVDQSLITTAQEIIQKRDGNNSVGLETLIEFSFKAGHNSNTPLRYIIDTSKWKVEDARELMTTGLESCGNSTLLEPLQATCPILGEEIDLIYLHYVGAEHSPDGRISSLKTYWDCPAGMSKGLTSLLSSYSKDFAEFLDVFRGLWPDCKRPRMLSVDFTPSDGQRIKVYFPRKDLKKPLSLSTFFLFLINAGIDTDFENIVKIAHFILGGQFEVVPSAFIVGLVIEQTRAVKLEISASAYFNNTKEALHATSALTLYMNINPL